jgi:hypothetical protein
MLQVSLVSIAGGLLGAQHVLLNLAYGDDVSVISLVHPELKGNFCNLIKEMVKRGANVPVFGNFYE